MKTAIITGAARGIGAAICKRAVRAGYRVGVLDLELAACQALASELGVGGHVALAADVTKEAEMIAAFDAFGVTPDLVVNNAGIVRFGTLVEQTIADFRAVVEVNLVGTYIGAREAATRMLKRGEGGVIINMSSLNAVTPGPGSGAYPSTKAGVAALTELLSLEVGAAGIRVNCVAPGFIDGGMSAAIYANQQIRELRGNAVPLKRLGTVEDIANTVLWLASDEASYITGQQIVVDGGVAHSALLHLPRAVN